MSGVEVVVRLTKAEALAVLKSKGLHSGWGVRKSLALQKAEMKLIGAIESAWNEGLVR